MIVSHEVLDFAKLIIESVDIWPTGYADWINFIEDGNTYAISYYKDLDMNKHAYLYPVIGLHVKFVHQIRIL